MTGRRPLHAQYTPILPVPTMPAGGQYPTHHHLLATQPPTRSDATLTTTLTITPSNTATFDSQEQRRCVYISRIPPGCGLDTLRSHVNKHGKVLMMRAPKDSKGRIRHCTIQFKTSEAAEACVKNLNESVIQEGHRPLYVTYSTLHSVFEGMANERLLILNIPTETTHDELKEKFTPFGNVVEATALSDPATGKNYGRGIVHFQTVAAATRALEMTQGEVLFDEEGGKPVEVRYWQPKAERHGKRGPKKDSDEDLDPHWDSTPSESGRVVNPLPPTVGLGGFIVPPASATQQQQATGLASRGFMITPTAATQQQQQYKYTIQPPMSHAGLSGAPCSAMPDAASAMHHHPQQFMPSHLMGHSHVQVGTAGGGQGSMISGGVPPAQPPPPQAQGSSLVTEPRLPPGPIIHSQVLQPQPGDLAFYNAPLTQNSVIDMLSTRYGPVLYCIPLTLPKGGDGFAVRMRGNDTAGIHNMIAQHLNGALLSTGHSLAVGILPHSPTPPSPTPMLQQQQQPPPQPQHQHAAMRYAAP